MFLLNEFLIFELVLALITQEPDLAWIHREHPENVKKASPNSKRTKLYPQAYSYLLSAMGGTSVSQRTLQTR